MIDLQVQKWQQLHLLCQQALDYLSDKADQSAVSLIVTDEIELGVRSQAVEQLVASKSVKISITVYINLAEGRVATTDTSWEQLKLLCDKACQIARVTAKDRCSGLPGHDLLYTNNPNINFKADYPWNISMDGLTDKLLLIEQNIVKDKRIKACDSVDVSCYKSKLWQGNSLGLSVDFDSTVYSLGAVCLAEDDGRLVRDSYYSIARDPNSLESEVKLSQEVVARTVSRIGARSLVTQDIPVLFSAKVTRSLFGYLAKAISGSLLYNDASFLGNKLGAKIFPEYINISQNPHLDNALGSKLFDGDGVATSKRAIISQGVLSSYILSYYSAQQLNLVTTGNAGGIQTWEVTDQQGYSLQELFEQLDRGLYITEIMGSGVDLTNGDFSHGVFGFYVKNGTIAYPVHEVTISGNLQKVFIGCQAIADDIDTNGVIRVGSMLVNSLKVAGSL